MNWNQLQYVITVAEEKSITKAARKLFISQPSLSLSIQALEKETGLRLFERTHGDMVLTYAGTLFYDWAVATLHSQNQLFRKLNDISQEKRSLLRIGLSPHRSFLMLPEILELFYAAFPDCEIFVYEKQTYLLKEMLENNQIDFMIDVPHPDTINYQNDLLIEEQIILAVPDSFLAEKEKETISLSDMAPYPFIMLSSEQILGRMSRKICESASFHPDIRITCENVDTALALASRQLGITFVPGILARQKRFEPMIRYCPIRQFDDTRQLCLVYPKNRYQPLQLAFLLRLFREIVPQLYHSPEA